MSKIKILIILIINLSIEKAICNVDPDIFRSTPELIESRGFQSEEYTVTTDDGYILKIFRIINPFDDLPKKPVLLLSGIFETTDTWLMSTPGHLDENGVYSENNGQLVNDCAENLTNTLGFTLATCDYDVWLMNPRGSIYSNQNNLINNTDPRFYDFTHTEQALDIPFVVDLVLRETGQSFIGFSSGSIQMWALLSMKPEFEQYINPYISIGTVTSLKQTNLRLIRPFLPILEPILRPIIGSIGFDSDLAQKAGVYLSKNKLLSNIVAKGFQLLTNLDPEQLDLDRFPLYLSKILTTSSIRASISHSFQLYHGFRKFDYGLGKNLEIYKQPQPPFYPIENITSRNIAIVYGLNDYSALSDLNYIKKRLKVPLKSFTQILWSKWQHYDNQWAKEAHKYLNNIILDILYQYD